MFKNILYLIGLLLITVVINAAVIRWLYPTPPQTDDKEQLEQVLRGIKQQSASISTLENNLKKLNNEISRIDAKTNQPLAQAAVVSTSTGATATTTAPVPDEHLTKVDKQLADLQQQLAALLANPNQANGSQTEPLLQSDPYAGMTPEQIKQQQQLSDQQQQQQLESAILTTADPGRTSQVSGSIESYLTSVKIVDSPPRVDCGTTLCRFQFDKPMLRTSEGNEVDPLFTLMESGAFPADGSERTIISQQNAQGGVNLYVGQKEDFPGTSPE